MRIALTMLLTIVAAAPAAAQRPPIPVAVLPFADGGSFGQDKANFDALQSALAAVLGSELAGNPAVVVVGRTETLREIANLKQGNRGRIDANAAARIGRALGARYVVAGTFTDHYGRFGMDARVIDARDGSIVGVAEPAASLRDRRDVARMLRTVATSIERIIDVGSPTRAMPMAATETITELGLGLDAEERGDTSAALEWYRRAAARIPPAPDADARLQALNEQ